MSEPMHIPTAKLRPPRIGVPLLERERLIHALRDGARRRLLVLSAEAGYGKTSLLVSALPHLEIPTAWYTLDESDADPNLFSAGLVAAIRAVLPESGEELLGILTTGPSPRDLQRALLRWLETLPPLAIVLDDLHALEGGETVLGLFDHLLQHVPATVHFLVATRTWPPLASLPRLLVQGEATVLDKTQLRFSVEDTTSFLRYSHALSVDREDADELTRRTEGWPAALQLVALASKSRGGRALGGTPRELFDYLAATVLRSLPADMQEFLLRTSILAELWPSLCAVVAPDADPAATLADLERRNLFVSRLDDAGPRYRYHQLFTEFLRHRLGQRGAAAVALLHRLAAEQLEAEGVPHQAVRHYFAAEAYGDAERVMKPLHGDRLTATLAYTFRDLVARLPEPLQQRYPWMTRCGASAARFVGDYTLGLTLARRSLAASQERDPNLWAFSVHGVGVMLGHLDRWEEAATLCGQALERLPPEVEPRFRGGIISDLLDAYLHLGRVRDAADLLPELSRIVAEGTQPGKSYGLAFYAGEIAAARLELGRAVEFFQISVRSGQERGSLTAQLWALLGLLGVQIERHDLPGAQRLLMETRRLHEQTGERASDLEVRCLAGDIHVLSSELDAAEHVYNGVLASLRDAESQEPRVRAHVGLARVSRAQGHVRQAEAMLAATAELCERLKLGRLLPAVRLQQVSSLRELGRIEDARRQLDLVREAMSRADSATGLAACDLLETQLALDGSREDRLDPPVRDTLRRALSQGAAHLPDLLPFLEDEAAWVVPLLIRAMREHVEDPQVHQILSAIGGPAVEALVAVLEEDALQQEAVALLGAIGDPRARRPLALIARRRPGLRALAQDALSHLRDPEPVTLRIRMLGSFEVFRGAERIPNTAWKTQKVSTLLKYLLVHRNRAVQADELIELLWPEADPVMGAGNLKTAVKTLRQILEPLQEGIRSQFVRRAGRTLRFVGVDRCEIDTDAYDRFRAEGDAHVRGGLVSEAITAFERGAGLYRGDLLEDDRYEDWAASERERRRESHIAMLETLASLHAGRRDYRRAIETIQQVIGLDRLRELAYRRLMEYALARGDRPTALRIYETCERLLREELGLSPQPETAALFEQARASTPA